MSWFGDVLTFFSSTTIGPFSLTVWAVIVMFCTAVTYLIRGNH